MEGYLAVGSRIIVIPTKRQDLGLVCAVPRDGRSRSESRCTGRLQLIRLLPQIHENSPLGCHMAGGDLAVPAAGATLSTVLMGPADSSDLRPHCPSRNPDGGLMPSLPPRGEMRVTFKTMLNRPWCPQGRYVPPCPLGWLLADQCPRFKPPVTSRPRCHSNQIRHS